MSKLYVNQIVEANSGYGVHVPGHVIQVQQYYSPANNPTSTSSTSLIASGVTKTITPKYSNSLIIIQCNITMAYSTGWGEARMYLNGSAMTNSSNYHVGYIDTSHNNYAPLIFQGQYQATSTGALNFEVYYRAGTGSFTITHNNSSAALTLMEIAQ